MRSLRKQSGDADEHERIGNGNWGVRIGSLVTLVRHMKSLVIHLLKILSFTMGEYFPMVKAMTG